MVLSWNCFAEYVVTTETATGLAKEGPYGVLVAAVLGFGALVVILRWLDTRKEIRKDEKREARNAEQKQAWIESNRLLADTLASLSENVVKMGVLLETLSDNVNDIRNTVAHHNTTLEVHEGAIKELQRKKSDNKKG